MVICIPIRFSFHEKHGCYLKMQSFVLWSCSCFKIVFLWLLHVRLQLFDTFRKCFLSQTETHIYYWISHRISRYKKPLWHNGFICCLQAVRTEFFCSFFAVKKSVTIQKSHVGVYAAHRTDLTKIMIFFAFYGGLHVCLNEKRICHYTSLTKREYNIKNIILYMQLLLPSIVCRHEFFNGFELTENNIEFQDYCRTFHHVRKLIPVMYAYLLWMFSCNFYGFSPFHIFCLK